MPKDQARGVAHADDEEDPVRIRTPVDASVCPTVGANCHRIVTTDAIGMAKERGRLEGELCRWCRNRVGHKHGEGHHDVPRFGALRRDNTPTPACLLYINDLTSYNQCSWSGSEEQETCRWHGSLLLLCMNYGAK